MNDPLIDLIRYVAESNYPDATKEELDFITYNVMKEIDDEMISKLKESVNDDLKLCHSRDNAKSGMDCRRLTGKNPFIEQEEQKKKRVRK